MLDNIVTETCLTAMPIEILADAKVNNKRNKNSEDHIQIKPTSIINQTAAAPVTKPNKTKTILNWLKNTTTNNTNTTINANYSNKLNKSAKSDNKEINSSIHNRFDKIIQQKQQEQQHQHIDSHSNCTCPKATEQNETPPSISLTVETVVCKDDDTLREFRGVQTLKHFWNKRITANRESALRAKGSKQITKSVSCLVNAISNTGEPPPTTSCFSPTPLSEKELLKVRKLRALSLHDCSRNSPDFDEISLSDIDIQKHLEKDNFYKYKTAEQALKLRELSEQSTHKKLSNSIILPVGQKTERFNWLKRHDKFTRKKSVELLLSPANEISNNTNRPDNSNALIAATSATNYNDIVINEHEMDNQQLQKNTTCLPTASGQNTAEVGSTNHSSETLTPTLTTANAQQNAISRRRPTTRKDSAKTLVSVSSISRDSSTTSLAASASSLKSVVKRNSSARKYSFKTHTRSYHVPRKMHTNKDAVSGATGIVVNSSNSLVAKLTQQFNEIIQKDKTLLDEIKRKNGVLMTHKGHVYKVVDTSSLNRNQSPTISRNGSRAHDSSAHEAKQSAGSSTVQRNIKKFESEARGLKPKVPLKSLQVLRKSNELVNNKTTATASARLNYNKITNKKETETKGEIKPLTLPLPATLEMVQEETKTPVENNENNEFENSKKAEEACKTAELADSPSVEETFKQDEFLAVLPPKIDSVIYKSIRKTKQTMLEAPMKEETLEMVTEMPNPNETVNDLQSKGDQNQWQNENEQINSCSEDEKNQTEIQDKELAVDKEIVDINLCNSLDQQPHTLLRETSSSAIEESESEKKAIDKTIEISTSPEHSEDDDKKKRKHKYAKIYEKLRFFTPFAHTNKKQKMNTTSPSSTEVSNLDRTSPESSIKTIIVKTDERSNDTNSILCENPILLKTGEYTPMSSPTPKHKCQPIDDVYSIMYNPEAKLLDALEQVDKKLQNLSNDNDKVMESDEYGQPLKPNSSFLHQTKDITPKPSTVIQAVNVTLVNAIEGEQLILEQKEIQQETEKHSEYHEIKTESKPLPPLPPLPSLPPKKAKEEEPLYEPICVDKTIEIKTEQSYKNCEFSQTNDCNTSIENCVAIEEDIYQTVEEAKNENEHFNTIKATAVVTKSIQELDGYEPIENPDDLKVSLSVTDSSSKPIHFDGYEEYTHAIQLAPLPVATTGVRRVTDELPDLPKPKRILPKSPIPCRSAPKPPILRLESTEEGSVASNCHDSHYYGGDENIYDTIKSSHCYESLNSVASNKLQNSPPLLRTKNSDCLSLTSNCYESISHYKRTNILGNGHHSGGSSNGSTLTISSENKTNSLYEDSLNSSLHYASKRIYHRNAHARTEINNSSIEMNGVVNGYSGSTARITDTSDEWTDVSDNESADTDNKPQFIIVRERSKAHKSPDWSRRVRDKRQRKSKSCIEDGVIMFEQLQRKTVKSQSQLDIVKKPLRLTFWQARQ